MGCGAYYEASSSGRARCKLCGELIKKGQGVVRFCYGAGNYTGNAQIHNNPFDCHESRQSLKELLTAAGGKQNA